MSPCIYKTFLLSFLRIYHSHFEHDLISSFLAFNPLLRLYLRSMINLLGIFELKEKYILDKDLRETIESGPLCIIDLFQNKYVDYF